MFILTTEFKTLCHVAGSATLLLLLGCSALFPAPERTDEEIFGQEMLAETIQIEPAKGYREWRRFADDQYGFTISYPPDRDEQRSSSPDALASVTFVSHGYPEMPVTVRVVTGTEIVDEFDLAASPLGEIVEYHLLQQGDRYASKMITQRLTGEAVTVETATTKTEYAIFKHRGKSYVIGLEYPLRQSDPVQMNLFYTMVEGFRLE
jgi:hypothetical protein